MTRTSQTGRMQLATSSSERRGTSQKRAHGSYARRGAGVVFVGDFFELLDERGEPALIRIEEAPTRPGPDSRWTAFSLFRGRVGGRRVLRRRFGFRLPAPRRVFSPRPRAPAAVAEGGAAGGGNCSASRRRASRISPRGLLWATAPPAGAVAPFAPDDDWNAAVSAIRVSSTLQLRSSARGV